METPYVPPIFEGPRLVGPLPDLSFEGLFRWLSKNAPTDTVYVIGGPSVDGGEPGGSPLTTIATLAGLGVLAWLVFRAVREPQKNKG